VGLKLENKITRWYGSTKATRMWIAKHWYRYITYGCPRHYIECSCGNINDPKGFAEMAEYCYNEYWDKDLWD
jgi:hypothetical protein